MQSSNLLTEQESAERAKISIETIRHYCKSGLIKAVTLDGQVFFAEDEIVSMFHVEPFQVDSELVSQQSIKLPSEAAEPIASTFDASQEASATAENQPETTTSTPPPESQLVSLTASMEVGEPIKNLRDQIEILKDERDWLRRQLERMESQFEREQMLLLSNSETLRRVVKVQPERKRNIWDFLLPWRWGSAPAQAALPHQRN